MTIKEFKFQYALGVISEKDLANIAITTSSEDILSVLAYNDNWFVRYWVAINSDTPTEVVAYLSDDENYTVKKAARKVLWENKNDRKRI